MTPFGIAGPGRILFGRGEASRAAALIVAFGARVLVVCGAEMRRSDWLVQALGAAGAAVQVLPCRLEPTLGLLEDAVLRSRGFAPAVVVGIGGGAVLDLAKALAALIPAPGTVMDHLEVVGRALPLTAPPLPFVAIPTTSGTGAEATKNAVIGVPGQGRVDNMGNPDMGRSDMGRADMGSANRARPDQGQPDLGRKVSLRDDRMLARLAIVDPALTDGCPRGVTLASGMDAITQVIEPYVSCKATPFTDALARPAIGRGLGALQHLMRGENPGARDGMAWVSLCGGLALANSGLGAVHGLAGVIGGSVGAAHGALCGALLGPVLEMNLARAQGPAALRLAEVCGMIAAVHGGTGGDAPRRLMDWAHGAGLARLSALGVAADDHRAIAEASVASSSMKGNPVALTVDDLVSVMVQAG